MGKNGGQSESKVKEAIRGTEGVPRGGTETKGGWWDKECIEKKKEVRKELRGCRRMGGNGGEYKRVKREYKALCEKKKKEENDRWEKQVVEARRENEVSKIINRERKKRKGINEGIGMEEWKIHFMRLLGGAKRKVRGREREREKGGREEEGEELNMEKVKKAIRMLKDGKATGIDELPSEA